MSGIRDRRDPDLSLHGKLAAAWGVGGIVLLLADAIYRLTPLAIETFDSALGVLHWGALVVWAAAMLVMEGYMGFQRSFSPRFAARARYLAEHPNLVRSLFAPFFCMGYFHATRGVQIRSILLTIGIVALVVGVRRVDQPWRGIIDLGVVLGLTWGTVSIAVFSYLAFATEGFGHSPETPKGK